MTPLTTVTRMDPNRIRMVALTTAMIIAMLPVTITAGIGTVGGSTGKRGNKHYTYVQNGTILAKGGQ